MYKIEETIIVEGIYDKIKLSRFIDGVIFVTHGFGVFKNDKMLTSIKTLAEPSGVVILTDSDAAGFKIRNYVKNALPKDKVKHAYIPDVHGKEKRKDKAGKEGLLGVEGIHDELILKALIDAGCRIGDSAISKKQGRKITKADLYAAGFSGGAKSADLRRKLSKDIGIPSRISANMLIDVLNKKLDYDEYIEIVQNISSED